MSTDLWGESIAPSPDPPDAMYPRPLDIPAGVPASTREWLLALPEDKRQTAIRRMLAEEAARERRRRREQQRRKEGNPLRQPFMYGPGPDGATCGTCLWLMRLGYHDQAYYKCAQRGEPRHSEANDHRRKWDACALYLERPDGAPPPLYSESELRAVLQAATSHLLSWQARRAAELSRRVDTAPTQGGPQAHDSDHDRESDEPAGLDTRPAPGV